MTRALRSMAFCVCFLPAAGASELDGPWISDTFFYWYTWDYQTELGGWMGGVHNTPLYGYYDSRTFKDNRHSLWLASEWGLTHHFMDYWDPNWKGEGGEMRERIVMRAAEDLRKAGYDIWMSYYQDGQNFEMKDFSKNVSEKRDVHQWLRDFARSPVWPKVNGYPLQLVYGRNGHPKTTKDDDGFRDFLRKRYADIAKLNADWGTSFAGFDQVGMDFGAKGHQRALSIKFQYETWAREWQRLDELVQKEFGLPGMKASFDVAYAPFLGFGYCDFARVFGGPHSYGGIFGQPQDQDVHRFIQAAVAKKYGTVFFDHFKNFYHDWNIRVPGAAFLPEPHHFDRFWVGALMRYAEALLHLSWNEWWEGSNLEPCYEYGKTYCEKNLFYATLMKLCFPSIQRWADGAQVAVILNDWSFLAGGRHPEDLYATIQTLRRLGCRFDLIPDGLLTAERLAPFKLVIAPSCGVGFSQEARAALLDWARGGQDRRLAVSADAKLATALGLKKLDKAALSSETGGDLNVFVDIGAESDEPFVVEGFSQRENWGKLPKGAFGEGTNATMRWTPGVGRATTLMLPLSPNREHVLRLQGSALWPNHAVVRLDGAPAAEFDVKPGFNEYEVTLPASKVGGRKAAAVTIEYATAHVPREQDPKRFPNEARVCNLALDYVQLRTSNLPARLTEQRFDWPKATLSFISPLLGSLNGRSASIRWQPHDSLAAENATTLSTYTADDAPRDILMRLPNAEVLYANGLFSEVDDAEYWRSLLTNWAKTPAEEFVKGDDVMSARLSAGDTQIVLAANYDIIKPKDIQLAVSAPLGLPLSEARLLAKDGSAHAALQADVADGRVRLKDRLGYYAVYQFAFSPVRLTVPELVAQPGETREFAVTAANISQAAVSGTIQVKSVIPTIVGEPVRVSLKPGEAVRVKLPLTVKDTADWGRKTVVIELSFNGRTAYLWRELVVQRNPQLRLAQPILDARKPILSLENTDDTFSRNATAQQVVAHLDGVRVRLADIPSGTRVDQPLDKVSVRSDERAMLVSKTLTVEHQVGAKTAKTTFPAHVAAMPGAFPAMKGALLPVVAFNPGDARECELAASGPSKGVHVRVADGRAVPSQPDGDGRAIFHAVLPPSSATTFYLCDGPSPAVKTDLSVSADALGTGRGKVTVRNSHLEVTLDEAKGGTVTRLKSLATGLDYAAESLGVSYGSFSHYDPTHPATNTVNFIHESKARQASTPGRITLLADGPVQAQVRVEWQDALVSVVQTYWFSAFQDYFRLRNEVKPKKLGDAEELVALDARFAVNKLTKSYPNFVGIRETKEQPHFGWRMGPWVPDYLTLMTPPRFEESLSLIVTRKQGVDSVRQGFWPRERPKAGPCEFAQIELISSTRSDVDLEVYVKLHEGHQIVAKRSLESLRQPPLVCPESNPKWAGTAREPVLTPADWLFPFHAYRAPVKVSGAKSGVVTATIDFASALGGAKLDANSVRVAEESVERPCAVHPERQAVQWQADGGAGGTRLFHVYFDALDAGPKPISRLRRTFALDQLVDEGFDDPRVRWAFSNATRADGEGRSGSAARLCVRHANDTSLVTCESLVAAPNATYQLSFWAKVVKGPAAVSSNFYQGAAFDFPQQHVKLTDDGHWHRYETTLVTRDFPSSVQPLLRLWARVQPQELLLDDVTVRTVEGKRPVALAVEVGTVQSISDRR